MQVLLCARRRRLSHGHSLVLFELILKVQKFRRDKVPRSYQEMLFHLTLLPHFCFASLQPEIENLENPVQYQSHKSLNEELLAPNFPFHRCEVQLSTLEPACSELDLPAVRLKSFGLLRQDFCLRLWRKMQEIQNK